MRAVVPHEYFGGPEKLKFEEGSRPANQRGSGADRGGPASNPID